MTNACSATNSNQCNDLMNAESANNVEDHDQISKNAATAIRNPCATSKPPPVQPSPSAQHPMQPSPSAQHPMQPFPTAQQTTVTTNMPTTTLSAHGTLPVVGTNVVQPGLHRGNHQIHHTCQNQQQHQTLDQNVTSGDNPTDLSSLVSTTRKKKDEPNAFDAEEVETEVLKRAKKELMSLPLELQSMAIEWAKELLSQKRFCSNKEDLHV